jgi:molybdate transport system ATP-binding protein
MTFVEGPRPFLQANIGVDYRGLTVSISLEAKAGEIVGIIGANGAGKTTVLRAVAGLIPLDRGSITIGGRVVDDAANEVFVGPQQRRVGVVFQDYRLFPHLTALENVAFGLRAKSINRKQAEQVALEWMSRLDDHRSHKPNTLSGGQAQRVALARALADEPAVLLLDEPLAAIDPTARTLIREDLGRYLSDFAGVTILVSHHHDDVRVLADSALVMEAGQVSWSGLSDELPG